MKSKRSIQILIVAIGFISLGAFRGEVQTVLEKGINLCLECIGIG